MNRRRRRHNRRDGFAKMIDNRIPSARLRVNPSTETTAENVVGPRTQSFDDRFLIRLTTLYGDGADVGKQGHDATPDDARAKEIGDDDGELFALHVARAHVVVADDVAIFDFVGERADLCEERRCDDRRLERVRTRVEALAFESMRDVGAHQFAAAFRCRRRRRRRFVVHLRRAETMTTIVCIDNGAIAR